MNIQVVSLNFIGRETAVILIVNVEYLNGSISVMAEVLQAILVCRKQVFRNTMSYVLILSSLINVWSVILLPNVSSCAWHIVRLKKLKCQSSGQRKTYCRAMQGEEVVRAPNPLNSPNGYSKAFLKARWGSGLVGWWNFMLSKSFVFAAALVCQGTMFLQTSKEANAVLCSATF